MTQFDWGNADPSDVSGTELLDEILEPFRDALHSNHKGPTRPDYVTEGTHWIDDASEPWYIKYFDGSSDLIIASANPTTHVLSLYHQGTVLGTVVHKNVGTGNDEVPTNSMLGTAASKNTGTSSGQIPLNSHLGAAAYLGIGHGLESSSGLRVKLDGNTIERSANGIKVAANAIGLAELAHLTADTLIGMDGDGVPSEITAGTGIVIDDGVISGEAGGLTDVSQGDINSAQSTISSNVGPAPSSTGWAVNSAVALPGGAYGFFPETSVDTADFLSSQFGGWLIGRNSSTYAAYLTPAIYGNQNMRASRARQLYVTASAPWDYGDGEAAGFIFLKIERTTGKVVQTYISRDPSWGYNGPTKVRPHYIDRKTGKKYRRIDRRAPIMEILKEGRKPEESKDWKTRLDERVSLEWSRRGMSDLRAMKEGIGKAKKTEREKLRHLFVQERRKQRAELSSIVEREKTLLLASEYQEITMAMKMADLDLIPHPFVQDDDHVIVVLDPMDERVRSLLIEQDRGLDVEKLIRDGVIFSDNDELANRKGPIFSKNGVMQVALKVK